MVNWQAFWSGLLGTTIPGLIVTLLVLRITSSFNRSLERFKFDLQRDTVRFSKWHEKRVDACVAVYVAFSQFLDFLRLSTSNPPKVATVFSRRRRFRS